MACCFWAATPQLPPTHWLLVKCNGVRYLPQSTAQPPSRDDEVSASRSPLLLSPGSTGLSLEITFKEKTQVLTSSSEEEGHFVFLAPAYFVMDKNDVPLSFKMLLIVKRGGIELGRAGIKCTGKGDTTRETLNAGASPTDYEIEIYCKFEDASMALQVFRESSDYSLLEVVNSIRHILKGPVGLGLLKQALRQELAPRDPYAVANKLEELFPEILDYLPDFKRNCSDEEAIRVLKSISRGILEFIVQYKRNDRKDLVEVVVGCCRRFFELNANVKRTALRFDEPRFRRLLCAAEIQVKNLRPAHKTKGTIVPFKDKYAREQKIDVEPSQTLLWEGIEHFSVGRKNHEARLAGGAYGQVWRAIDIHTGRTFAVKNVMPITNAEDREKGSLEEGMNVREQIASQEVELLMRLMDQDSHPCIVDFYHVESLEDPRPLEEMVRRPTIFLHVMEFCSGGNLYNKIAKSRSPKGEYIVSVLAMKWIGEIFLALEYLHLILEMLHRDLKPENIVFDERSVAKLTDFGRSMIGNQRDSGFTYGFPPGNTDYTAPEVYDSEKKYDSRADLYSFGALIWFILTGGIKYKDHKNKPYFLVPKDGDYWQNCRAMEECLTDDLLRRTKYGAPDLPCESSKDLVRQLTRRDKDSRPFHDAIRIHSFMRTLQLPDRGASFDVVSSWAEMANA